MITESPLNNPQHPCGFCSKLVPLGQPYCDNACRVGDELLKGLDDSPIISGIEIDKAYQEWLLVNTAFVP